MNKETRRDCKHKVFFFDHRKNKCKRVFRGQHFSKYSLDSAIPCLFSRDEANLYVGFHPCINFLLNVTILVLSMQ